MKQGNKSLNFETFCSDWMQANAASLKASSISKYQSFLQNHIFPTLGTYQLSDITSETVRDFSSVLLYQRQLSAKTVRDILTLLHQILADSRIQDPTLFPITVSYPKMMPEELRVLDSQEQRTLLLYLNQDMDIYRFAVLLALSTGLRLGEVCGLCWGDFSLEAETVRVRRTVQRIKNIDKTATNKTILHVDTPKTPHSVRTIPLIHGMVDLCRRFYSSDEEAFILTGTATPAEPRTLQRKLEGYASECHLQNIHFHTLRHTFATRCVEVGCDVKTLSEILGHANIAMTMNRYVHPSLEFKRQNIKKLEQAGFGCLAQPQ